MKYVYLLQSISHPEQRYVGLTSDFDKRLAAHNTGQSPHTDNIDLGTLQLFMLLLMKHWLRTLRSILNRVPDGLSRISDSGLSYNDSEEVAPKGIDRRLSRGILAPCQPGQLPGVHRRVIRLAGVSEVDLEENTGTAIRINSLIR